MFRKPIALAAFAAMGLLGTSARAQLTITIQETGGSAITIVSDPGAPSSNIAGSGGGSTTDYSVTVQAYNADQTSSGSELLGSAVSIKNTTGATGKTLTITITANGYTAPVTPPNIQAGSTFTGNVLRSGSTSDTASLTSSVSGATYAPPGAFTSQSTTLPTGVVFGFPQGFSTTAENRTITSLGGTFTVSEVITFQLNNLNDQVNYSSGTTLASVPEPSTMAIAGLGALGLIGYGLRRRKALGA